MLIKSGRRRRTAKSLVCYNYFNTPCGFLCTAEQFELAVIVRFFSPHQWTQNNQSSRLPNHHGNNKKSVFVDWHLLILTSKVSCNSATVFYLMEKTWKDFKNYGGFAHIHTFSLIDTHISKIGHTFSPSGDCHPAPTHTHTVHTPCYFSESQGLLIINVSVNANGSFHQNR